MNFKALMLVSILLTLASFTLAQTDSTEKASAVNAAVASGTARSDDAAPAPVEPVAARPRHYGPVSFRRDGLWFSNADASTHLQVHGYVQGDDRMFQTNIHGEPVDTFLFRKMRPLFEGSVLNNIDFRFMPDFGQNNPQVQEAFLELKTVSFARLRVGKFKEPIGLEALRQDRDLTFVERSMASDLVPLRYIGAQISGSALSNSITYEGGYFKGSNDGSNGVFTQWAPGNEAAARVFVLPFSRTGIDAISHFGMGVGGSAGSQRGSIAGLKTIGQATWFKYSSTTVADGQHNRLAPQAYYYAGPFGFMGEYVISSQEVLNKGLTGRIRNEAWQAAGSVLLTGEKNAYTGVRARNAFEPGRGFDHFGALELAFRYSQVRIDGDAFPHFASIATAPRFAGETGIGFNWYFTRYVKLQTEYEHTGFRMAAGNSTPLRSENLLLSQVQLSF